jgi:hypothetical protein
MDIENGDRLRLTQGEFSTVFDDDKTKESSRNNLKINDMKTPQNCRSTAAVLTTPTTTDTHLIDTKESNQTR